MQQQGQQQSQQVGATTYIAPNAPSSRTFVTQGRFAMGSKNTERCYPCSIPMMIIGGIGFLAGIGGFVGLAILLNSGGASGFDAGSPLLGFGSIFLMFVSCVCWGCGYNARRSHQYYAQMPTGSNVVVPPMEPYSYNQQTAMVTQPGYPPSAYPSQPMMPGGYPSQPMSGGAVQVTHNFTPAGYQPQPFSEPNVPTSSPDVPAPPPYNENFDGKTEQS